MFYKRGFKFFFNNLTRTVLSERKTFSSIKSPIRISILNKIKPTEESVTVKGWVKGLRKLKNHYFVDVNDGSCPKSMQVVINKDSFDGTITYGTSILASGKLGFTPKNEIELVAENVELLGGCDLDEFPFKPKKSYSNEYIRQYLHLRVRTRGFSSLLRVRNEASLALNDFFSRNGFINVHTPVLTSNDCEGAGEVFSVLPESAEVLKSMRPKSETNDKEVFFGANTYLTVSGQLHLEAAARGLGNVYSFGPIFRAENSKSRLHLSEFYMTEAESSYWSKTEDITTSTENLIKFITESVLNKCPEDVETCRNTLGEAKDESKLENLTDKKFTVMSFNEATDILNKSSKLLKVPHKSGDSLSKEHELFLVKHNSFRPIFIVEWPKSMKPFYMKGNPDNPQYVFAFDLLCDNVGEVCGGSIRQDNLSELEQSLIDFGLQEKLNWYLDLRRFGNVTTGGYGLGFDRYLQVLLNITNIKDVIPFPRWPHNCQM